MTQDVEGIRTFLADHVPSFELLVVLVDLQSDPASLVTAASAHARTGLALEDANDLLRTLERHGFCVAAASPSGPAFRYAPRTDALAKGTAALADAYRTAPGTVARLMSEVAIDRMRSITARAFADSFVIGKKTDG